MSENSGSSGRWAGGGMTLFPGFNPRPEYLIYNKQNSTENINSTSKALFVHAKDSEKTEINIVGKIGKLIIENCNSIKANVSNNIVAGTLEVIKSHNIEIHCHEDAVVPVIQVDDSSEVNVYIQKKEQIECIIFTRSKGLKLFLENQTVDGEGGQTLQYEVSTDEIIDVQRVGHWTAASVDADFMTENFIRKGKYPTVSDMANVRTSQNNAAS